MRKGKMDDLMTMCEIIFYHLVGENFDIICKSLSTTIIQILMIFCLSFLSHKIKDLIQFFLQHQWSTKQWISYTWNMYNTNQTTSQNFSQVENWLFGHFCEKLVMAKLLSILKNNKISPWLQHSISNIILLLEVHNACWLIPPWM